MKPNPTFLILLLLHLQLTGCQPSEPQKKKKTAFDNHLTTTQSLTFPKPLHQEELTEKIEWTIDNKTHDLKQTNHYQLIGVGGKIQNAVLDTLAAQMESSHTEIEAFTGKKSTLPPMKCYLYPSAEKKGLLLQNTHQSHINFDKNEIHIVFNQAYKGNLLQLENQILLRHLLGKPSNTILEEGLSLQFAPKWQKYGSEYWANRLYQSDNLPSIQFLLNNKDLQYESYLLQSILSGTFTSFLLQYWGKATFLKYYKNWASEVQNIPQLEEKWQDFLQETHEKYKAEITAQFPSNPTQTQLPYFKGFNFAHEGYQIYDGYISQQATEALEAMAKIGVNTSAIVPYTGMRNVNHLQTKDIRVSRRAVQENDESVIHSAFQSKKLGMMTILKPQVWVWNSWPGDITFETVGEWDAFFEQYYQWILHYALIAEINQMDVLCLGVEFVKATLQYPEKWKTIIQRINGLYSGKLTYAANWGAEFEENVLWSLPELDYIGINCYYPLSKAENPTDKELQKGFATILEKIENIARKYNKKVIFTEIGFRSIAKPWQNPHHYEWNNHPKYEETDQQRCYQAVFAALDNNKDWCQGILWWKWPSYLSHSQDAKTEFAPNGKAAEKVVEQWFLKKP